MGKPPDIEKSDRSSLVPRETVTDASDASQQAEENIQNRRKHAFTPVKAMKVQYWHQGETPTEDKKPEVVVKKSNHAQRADHLGLLLLGCAVLVVVLVSLTLFLNSKNYLFATPKDKEASTATVDFYQGNHVFTEKVAAEKAAKQTLNGHQVHGISTVNDDLEVPLSEQMSSMNEKMKKMRSLQQADEEAPPLPDKGPTTVVAPVKATSDVNFKSPLEFNSQLPKSLQTNH